MGKNKTPLSEQKKFIVANEKGLKLVQKFVKAHGANGFSYSDPKCLNIGYDSNPDSDWSKWTPYARIIVANESLLKEVRKEIRLALGWSLVDKDTGECII